MNEVFKLPNYNIKVTCALTLQSSEDGQWMNHVKIHQTLKTPLKYEGKSLVLVFFIITIHQVVMTNEIIDNFVDSQQLMFRVLLKHTFHIKLDL